MTTVAVAHPSPPIPGSFYQRQPPGEPLRLELMAREPRPGEYHFYISGVAYGDLAPLIAPTLASSPALIYRLPPGLLNPNYWEPYTKEGEEAVRAKLGGVIMRDDGGATWLWRSDGIAPGRQLRDGIDVPVELLEGRIFKTRGTDLAKLGEAWAASRAHPKDRFEWAAFGAASLPADGAPDGLDDTFRLQTGGAILTFAATGEGRTRLAFASRSLQRACARAALRGYMSRCAGRVVSPPNDRVCDQFIAHADRGLTSLGERDFVSKGTAFEFTARPGQTPWSDAAADGIPDAGERVLVYYDRVAGIWAVAS